jgi:two-component system, LuxR family, sensor kinase FixL
MRRAASSTPEAPAPGGADDSAIALARHLRDREQLLFTSRSISIGEMASTLAHEINQPVGTIVNVLRGVSARLARLPIAAEHQAQLDELHQGLKLALDQAQFASRIVGRIREFTQARQPEPKPLDLRALALESVALLDWEFTRQNVPVVLDMPTAWWVVGDALMLQQVLVNLLRNALQAHRGVPEAQARVALHLQPLGETEVELTIVDQGCGISASVADTLFVPFQSSKPDGMGIGLNICRSFVELHQGRLWFTHNPSPPGGCTFHLALKTTSPPQG